MSLFKKRNVKTARPKAEAGERWQLTVLFYDIVGSTSLDAVSDPEALRDALNEIHETANEVLTEHGGSLEQVMGDGGMAYFGYPKASEEAAFQAVSAALALLEAREEIDGAPDIRIGIATSVVVLPDRPDALASGRLGAVGVAPNLAARLEGAAGHNQILVGAQTHAITRRSVDYDVVGDLSLKGFPDVTRAFRPIAIRDADTRFERDREQSTHLEGRSAEVAQLSEALLAAQDGYGRTALVIGEPGIGKSRLVAEIAAKASAARIATLQCQPRTEGEALFAVIQMYERAYEAGTDPPFVSAAEATAERLAALEENETLSNEARRKAIVEAVTQILADLARSKPLLLIAEDLHWADEVTLAVLEELSFNASTLPLLLLGTARPGVDLGDLPDLATPLSLGHVTTGEAQTLIAATADTDLSHQIRDWIVEKGDGNPLFLVELTRYALDLMANGGGVDSLSGAEVGSLRDLLATRLESAGQAKRTAQIASVLGRTYPYQLLAKLPKAYSGQELDVDLQRLIDHGLHEAEKNGYAYAFRHALIREVAYDSQLGSVRKALHAQVVALVDANPDLADDVPTILLAEHCMAAEQTERGLALLLDVAEDAIRRSALHAPRAMLERVLEAVTGLGEGAARNMIELRAIALLGPLIALLQSHRAAAPLYERGQALYFTLDADTRAPFFPILWGWWFTATDLSEQTRRSEILIRDVRPDADPESRLQALHCGWATLYDSGAHDRCLSAIDDGLALFDPDVARRSRYLYGHDAKTCGLGERALCTWLTGDLETSAAAIQACEHWSDETEHLSSQLHGLDIATQLAVFNQDLPEIDRILSRIEALTSADAAPILNAKRQIFGGWIAARRQDLSKVDDVKAGLAALREYGVVEDTPFYADIAAEISAATGDLDGALGPLNEEIDASRQSGLIYWQPELLRRKALLLGGSGAEDALDEGAEIAEAQNAQMLVLRNVETRLRLRLSVPSDLRARIAETIGKVSNCPLRQQVMRGLGL